MKPLNPALLRSLRGCGFNIPADATVTSLTFASGGIVPSIQKQRFYATRTLTREALLRAGSEYFQRQMQHDAIRSIARDERYQCILPAPETVVVRVNQTAEQDTCEMTAMVEFVEPESLACDSTEPYDPSEHINHINHIEDICLRCYLRIEHYHPLISY